MMGTGEKSNRKNPKKSLNLKKKRKALDINAICLTDDASFTILISFTRTDLVLEFFSVVI